MYYEAQQAGGLTDVLFEQDPRQSIRDRNWFSVTWNLASLSLDYRLSSATQLNIRNFGLVGERNALGFLGLINRVDPGEERDLILDKFRNIGNETRLIHRYSIKNNWAALLVGMRYYRGFTSGQQGDANDGDGPDFEFLNPGSPDYFDYDFPSSNLAFFAENVFNLSKRLSLTPGVRFEYIKTSSDGSYREVVRDLAGNIIFEETIPDAKSRERRLALLGLGLSYKTGENTEFYSNISQNYRAINFNDLRIVNPNFRVDENIQDERGYNIDAGFRGTIDEVLTFDVSAFYLRYEDRIGVVLRVDEELFNIYRFRTNVADSRNVGVEAFAEWDLLKWWRKGEGNTGFSVFMSGALIDARYINSNEPAIDNKKVELVPEHTLRTGMTYRRQHFRITWQYSYTGDQYSDATNAELTSTAVNGLIPAYSVMDLSASYDWKLLRFETGVNNLADEMYFTRRASGYPGPGIIPADGRSLYLTVQLKL